MHAGAPAGVTCCCGMQSVLRAGGLLHTLGGRRGAGPYGDALNYEAMLALDENNVRRGVRKAVLERLHVVRSPLGAFCVLFRAPSLRVTTSVWRSSS